MESVVQVDMAGDRPGAISPLDVALLSEWNDLYRSHVHIHASANVEIAFGIINRLPTDLEAWQKRAKARHEQVKKLIERCKSAIHQNQRWRLAVQRGDDDDGGIVALDEKKVTTRFTLADLRQRELTLTTQLAVARSLDAIYGARSTGWFPREAFVVPTEVGRKQGA